MKAPMDRVLVLGLGNVLLSDEGFGVHVARRLRGVDLPEGVDVVEGGVAGFDLLGHLEGVERLLVVDVMVMGGEPGRLRLIRPGEELREPGKQTVSFHQVGILQVLETAKLIGYEPEVAFLVCKPDRLDWGMELSPIVSQAADRAVDMIQDLCRQWPERSEEVCIHGLS